MNAGPPAVNAPLSRALRIVFAAACVALGLAASTPSPDTEMTSVVVNM